MIFQVFGRMVPIFNGLGFAMITVAFLGNIYYVVITAWTFYYLGAGFTSTLPWGSCTEDWNTIQCYSIKYEQKCQFSNNRTDMTWFMNQCLTYDDYCNYFGNRSYVVINEVNSQLFSGK